MNSLTDDEFRTLLNLYELVCHLVHLSDQFLTQFCDAVAILGANELLVKFISNGKHVFNTIELVKRLMTIFDLFF